MEERVDEWCLCKDFKATVQTFSGKYCWRCAHYPSWTSQRYSEHLKKQREEKIIPFRSENES